MTHTQGRPLELSHPRPHPDLSPWTLCILHPAVIRTTRGAAWVPPPLLPPRTPTRSPPTSSRLRT